MELPVIEWNSHDRAPDRVVRAVKMAAAELALSYCNVVDISEARLFSCRERADIREANFAADVTVRNPAAMEKLLTRIGSHYRSHSLVCHRLIPAQAVPEQDDATAVLARHGYAREPRLVMMMDRARWPASVRTDLQVLPARSAMRLYGAFQRAVHEVTYTTAVADGLAACAVDVLDDSRLDMFVARLNGRLVAAAGVMSLGQNGVLWDVSTHPDYRRQGIQKALLSYLLDHCARSQFVTLALETPPDNRPAIRMYESIGMTPLCTYDCYRLTETD